MATTNGKPQPLPASAYGVTPAADQQPPADLAGGEFTGRQSVYPGGAYGNGYVGGGLGLPFGAFGGGNPCAFPGYDAAGGLSLYAGNYQTYRWMLSHPVIRLARSIVTSPILASAWGYEKTTDDVPDEYVDTVRAQLDPLRDRFMADALRCLDFGWVPFEKVWDIEGGQYVIKRLKPLLWDWTTILIDAFGNPAGVSQGGNRVRPGNVVGKGPDGQDVPGLGVYKSMVIAYDTEAGNPYGRSMLENVRGTAWRSWLDTASQLHNLRNKLSGIIPLLFVPAGTFPDKDGNAVDYGVEGQNAIQQLHNLQGFVFRNLMPMAKAGMSASDLAALAAASSTKLDFYDAGNHAPAIAGFLDQLRHDEELMFAGYLRSPRTGMESAHGSRADAQQHTDTGTLNCELIDDEIAQQVTASLVGDILELNFGPDARGAVRVAPAPLVDSKTAVFGDLLAAGLKDPAVGPALAGQVKWEAVFEQLDIPPVDGANVSGAIQEALQAAKTNAANAAKAPTMQPGGPPAPGAENATPPDAKAAQLSRDVEEVRKLLGDE